MIDCGIDSMPRPATPQLSGWGRIPVPGREVLSEDLRKLTENATLTRGLGRSYGDSSLPPPGRFEVAPRQIHEAVVAVDDALPQRVRCRRAREATGHADDRDVGLGRLDLGDVPVGAVCHHVPPSDPPRRARARRRIAPRSAPVTKSRSTPGTTARTTG